jgi:acyl carrier protein
MRVNKFLSKKKFFKILKNILPISHVHNEYKIYLDHINLKKKEILNFHSCTTKNKIFYKYLEYKPFQQISESKEYLKKLLALENNIFPSAKAWFIKLKTNNKIIGTARFVDINFNRKSLSWGYGLDPDYWGKDYLYEVQKILLNYMFEVLKINRLGGYANLANKSTVQSLKSIGAIEEGIFKQSMRDYKGNFHDSWHYRILASEYFLKDKKKKRNIQKIKITINQVIAALKKILKIKKLDEQEIFIDNGKWDSLKRMTLVIDLENFFKVKFSSEEIYRINSANSLYKVLQEK